MLRIDVRYMQPNNLVEVGLVDYPPDAEPTTPTLFVGAYCNSSEDRRWFEERVREIIERSEDSVIK